MNKSTQAAQILKSAKKRIGSEQQALMYTGRSLSNEERQRLQTLDALETDIEQALSNLQDARQLPSPYHKPRSGSPMPLDGRYTATNDTLTLDLHVDVNSCGIISGDLFTSQTDYRGDFHSYASSFRSEIGLNLTPSTNPLPIVAYDNAGRSAKGELFFNTTAGNEIALQLYLEDKVKGLPVRRLVPFSGRQISQTMREVCLEIESECGAEAVPEASFNNEPTSIKNCLEDAGLEVYRVGRYHQIPTPPLGRWDSAQVHGLMTQFSREPFDRKAWNIVTLMLRKPEKKGVISESFLHLEPKSPEKPKSGVASFQEELKEFPRWEQKVIQSTVHAIGHAMNLENRFDPEVGKQSSASIMNCDWKYLGGDNSERYWRDFTYSFDRDELAFLHHAPQTQLHPSTALHRLTPYWQLAENDSAGLAPQLPSHHYQLTLLPPKEGHIFKFGQPVLLGVELKNTSGRADNIPACWLDAKAGLLKITVRRRGMPWSQEESAQTFRPLIRRCYDLELCEKVLLPNDGTLRDNINLTYGLDGFTFAQTGSYTITASLYLHQGRRPCVIQSEPMHIRIANPKTDEEERDGHELLHPECGYAFALGGTDVFPEATRIFDGIIERRQRRGTAVSSPLVANILRCRAINLSRDFVSYKEGRFTTRPANIDTALMTLRWLNEIGPRVFDPATNEQVKSLVAKCKERIGIKK